jgi:hypothetical protein
LAGVFRRIFQRELTRTALLRQIGGFHGKLLNGEDKLACLQIRARGFKILLDSRFGVLHLHSPTGRADFSARVYHTFRDVAFIYGATSSLWKVLTFHANCFLSCWTLYKNNSEMHRTFTHHKNTGAATTEKSFSQRLFTQLKVLIVFLCSNKSYMVLKGYWFQRTNRKYPMMVAPEYSRMATKV